MQEIFDTSAGIGNQPPMAEVFQAMVNHASARVVYGEPVSAGDRTIVPVARVRYGFGGGGGKSSEHQRGGGGGGGLVAQPVGIVEVSAAGTRFIPISTNRTLLAAFAFGVFLGAWAARRRLFW